jgi:hypothetical protein
MRGAGVSPGEASAPRLFFVVSSAVKSPDSALTLRGVTDRIGVDMAEYSSVTERWLPVVGYEGYYEVSDLGRVRSFDRLIIDKRGYRRFHPGRILRAGLNTVGYAQVNLCLPNQPQSIRLVHHLVLDAFIGPRPVKMERCHNNGISSDNRLVNLRYDTSSENGRDIVKHGKHNCSKRTHCPANHLLVMPNLVEWHRLRGHRQCLSCHRARMKAKKLKLLVVHIILSNCKLSITLP